VIFCCETLLGIFWKKWGVFTDSRYLQAENFRKFNKKQLSTIDISIILLIFAI